MNMELSQFLDENDILERRAEIRKRNTAFRKQVQRRKVLQRCLRVAMAGALALVAVLLALYLRH